MPQIKVYEEKYAREAFWKEVDGKGAMQGLKSNAAIGAAIGITGQCVGKYRRDTFGRMQLKTMQSIVKVLKPDPEVILRLLGYSDKEINKFAKEAAQ